MSTLIYKTVIALIGSCVLFNTPAFAAKPSFNCSKATHEIEQLICSDDELAALDVSLNSLYKTVLKNTPAAAQKRLKSGQIGWSKGRNDCWKSDDKRACAKSEYETRINALKESFNSQDGYTVTGWYNEKTGQCINTQSKDNKVEFAEEDKNPKCTEAAAQAGGGGASAGESSEPSKTAKKACATRFGGKSSIKTVSALKPGSGWWEIIMTGKKGRQIACTVNDSGAIDDWVEM